MSEALHNNTIDELARLVPSDRSWQAVTLADKAKALLKEVVAAGADVEGAVEKAIAEVKAEFEALTKNHETLGGELESYKADRSRLATRLTDDFGVTVPADANPIDLAISALSSKSSEISSLRSQLSAAQGEVATLKEAAAASPVRPVSDEHKHEPAAGETPAPKPAGGKVQLAVDEADKTA